MTSKELGKLLFDNHTHAELEEGSTVLYHKKFVLDLIKTLGGPEPDWDWYKDEPWYKDSAEGKNVCDPTYKIKYWYLATGMDGVADQRPESSISADSRDKAVYTYCKSFGLTNAKDFDEFIHQPQYIREWGLKVEKEETNA